MLRDRRAPGQTGTTGYLRIYFGKDVGKKRRGAGALDPTSAKNLADYVGDRRNGPLFLSPSGHRLTEERLLDAWREAFGLALVDELWPDNMARSLTFAVLVTHTLLRGRPHLGRGGNPRLVHAETRHLEADARRRVRQLCDRLWPRWHERMMGVDLHGLRMTHHSWARDLAGVPPGAIDRQLGHAASEMGVPKELRTLICGSETGLKHYRDRVAELCDPTLSARAVRDLVDKALARLCALPTCLVVEQERVP